MQAVFRQLVGRNVPPDGAGFCRLDHHVPEEIAETLLRPADVLVPMQKRRRLAGMALMLDEGVGGEDHLIRHYWVLAKPLMNVFANVVLLLFVERLSSSSYSRSDAPPIHAVVALLLLLVATILSVHKPRGITPYGWRKLQERRLVASRRRADSLTRVR